jgi:hypothetical protein
MDRAQIPSQKRADGKENQFSDRLICNKTGQPPPGKSRFHALKIVGLTYADEIIMKVVLNKVKRSGFYYLINPIAPINHALKVKSDTWGSVIVIGLVLGVVSVVRLILSLSR